MSLAMFDNSQLEREVRQALLRTELEALSNDLAEYKKYRDYYNGEQSLVYSTDLFKDLFGSAFEGFKDNWMRPIISAEMDKLVFTGVGVNRVDGKVPAENKKVAQKVWDAFRMNEIEEFQDDLHEGALVESTSHLIIWPDDEFGVTMDWQPAGLVNIRYDSDSRRKALWAVKRWKDDLGNTNVSIYTPQHLWKFTESEGGDTRLEASSSDARDELPDIAGLGSLKKREVDGEEWPLPHPFGEVPVIEYLNTSSRSELVDAIPQQDALNKILLDMLVASEFHAVPQRIIESLAKEPIGGWKSGAGEVWHLPPAFDPDGKIISGKWGTFETGDPGNFIQLIELFRQHMALTSRTPLRYFVSVDKGGRGDAPSGESLQVEDQPLNNKVARVQRRLGNRHMQAARIVAKGLNLNPKALLLGDALWEDPRNEYRLAILEEAKLMSEIGMPFKWIVTQLGLTPLEQEQLIKLKDEEVDQAKQDEADAMAAQAELNDSNDNSSNSNDGSSNGSPSDSSPNES